MANTVGSFNLGVQLPDNLYNVTTGGARDPSPDAAAVDYTDVDDAVGVLVADGASPTQAHVTTLDTAWGILKTAMDAAAASAATLDDDVTIMADYGAVTDFNKAQSLVLAVKRWFASRIAGPWAF